MKRLISTVMILVLLACSLASCGIYTDDEIDDYKFQISELQDKVNTLRGKVHKLRNKNSALKDEIADINGSGSTYASTDNSEPVSTDGYTVYYTNTGSKYHAYGCRYLRYSSYPCSVSEAQGMGLSPCSVCNP